MAPGTDIGLEAVWVAVSEQYPSSMPSLHPGVVATDPRPFGTWDAMWLALQALTYHKTPAINGKSGFLAYFVVGRAVIRPVGAPTRR